MSGTDHTSYPCKDGFLCDAGSQTEEGSQPCPIDSFCTAGAATTCPAGTYSLVTGLVSTDECIECAPGKYCPDNSNGITDCPTGYYCPGNLISVPTGTDNQCTAGHYCPGGTAVEILCEPGYYQSGVGATECTECDVGSYCPDSGMDAPTDCTSAFTDWYCPAGSIQPAKCPIGTFAEDDTQSCTTCPMG